MAILIIVGIIVLLGIIFASMYNSLVRLRNNRENAFADIDVQLKQRHDLIPQLVETVKGYASHEKETLDRVIQARNGAVSAKTIDEKIAAENQLSSALSGLKITLEAYPDLKANQNFLQLQEEVSDVENKLAAVRRYFNSATKEYNNAVQTFPSNIVAGMAGFRREIMFDLGTNERANWNKRRRSVSKKRSKHAVRRNSNTAEPEQPPLCLSVISISLLVAALLYLACYLLVALGHDESMETGMLEMINPLFINALPYTMGIVLIWFLIAFWMNTSIIKAATGAKPLDRRENKRVYNLVENLCMANGMKAPKINIIDDNSLNAFASGINDRTYTVTLSRGIIQKLNDEELEAVIAHELTHIRNRDVRLLIVSIVFVGIFSMLAQITFYTITHTRIRSNGKNGGGVILIMLIALVIAAVGFFFASLMRFAISRKREYMADAGSAEMTKNPLALASALRKISDDPNIEAVKRGDVAQLFIQNPGKQSESALSGFSGLFATHPPIEKRISILEQF